MKYMQKKITIAAHSCKKNVQYICIWSMPVVRCITEALNPTQHSKKLLSGKHSGKTTALYW